MIFEAKDGSSEALGQFLERYRRPLYAMARARGLNPEDAEDGVSDFIASFCHPQQKRLINLRGPEEGLLRKKLSAWFKNFLVDEWRKTTSAKSGGKIPHSPYDEPAIAQALSDESLTPSEALDAVWAQQWYQRSQERFRAEFAAEPALVERIFEGRAAEKSLEDLAKELGFTFAQVRHRLHKMKDRFQSMLKEELAATVATPQQVEEELGELMQALRRLYQQGGHGK